MSQGISPGAGPRKRRRLTPAFFKRASSFYAENGWQATAKKFRLSGSQMQKVRNGVKEKLNGHMKQVEAERTGRGLYLAAKALERALMEHRRAGSPPSDIEHYAFFLLREILPRGTSDR